MDTKKLNEFSLDKAGISKLGTVTRHYFFSMSERKMKEIIKKYTKLEKQIK